MCYLETYCSLLSKHYKITNEQRIIHLEYTKHKLEMIRNKKNNIWVIRQSY